MLSSPKVRAQCPEIPSVTQKQPVLRATKCNQVQPMKEKHRNHKTIKTLWDTLKCQALNFHHPALRSWASPRTQVSVKILGSIVMCNRELYMGPQCETTCPLLLRSELVHPRTGPQNLLPGGIWCFLQVTFAPKAPVRPGQSGIASDSATVMDVDQNKGIWSRYNRRSTANQTQSQRCQSREGSVVCDTILRRESSKHCYISQYLETWREPGPTQAGLTIADQPRSNRGFHPHFLKIELIWVVRLWTCCSDFLCYWLSLLTTVSRQIRIQYNIKLKCNDHAMKI